MKWLRDWMMGWIWKISELTTKVTEFDIREKEFKKKERKLNKNLRKRSKREVVEDDVNTTYESENCVEKIDDNGNTLQYGGELDQKLQPALHSEVLAFQHQSPTRKSSPGRMPATLHLSPHTPPGLPPSLPLECQSIAALSSYSADETPDKLTLTPDSWSFEGTSWPRIYFDSWIYQEYRKAI